MASWRAGARRCEKGFSHQQDGGQGEPQIARMTQISEAGFDIQPGADPIVPIMLYNAKLSQDIVFPSGPGGRRERGTPCATDALEYNQNGRLAPD